MFVRVITCPCWICYECVQFQIEIRKISGRGSRSSDNQESFYVVDLQRKAKKCIMSYNACYTMSYKSFQCLVAFLLPLPSCFA